MGQMLDVFSCVFKHGVMFFNSMAKIRKRLPENMSMLFRQPERFKMPTF